MKNLSEKLISEIKRIAFAFIMALSLVRDMIKNHVTLSDMVTISDGNIKTGKIKSFSTLPFITCHKRCLATCGKQCYAKKICLLRPSVMSSYAKNTAIAKLAMHAVFKAINKSVKNSVYFRYHVSGDIINKRYFNYMVKTAKANKHCTFLCFTKQYEIVNEWIEKNGKLPKNLKILFSGWTNLVPVNPYNLPETNVYKTESEMKKDWIPCGGNCLDCACSDSGCWKARNGQTVAFKIH